MNKRSILHIYIFYSIVEHENMGPLCPIYIFSLARIDPRGEAVFSITRNPELSEKEGKIRKKKEKEGKTLRNHQIERKM